MESSDPPPQTPRPKRQNKGSNPSGNRQPSNRSKGDRTTPSWDASPPADVKGDFDDNGNFVMSNGSSAVTSNSKKPKGRRQGPNGPQISALGEQIKEMKIDCGDFDEHGNFVLPNESSESTGVNGATGATGTSKKKTKSSKKPRRKDDNRKDIPIQEHAAFSPSPVNNSPTPPWMGKTPSQLYAAPNFSNSPAASALPIPKFAMKNLSKSLPISTSQPSLQSRLDRDQSPQGPSDSSSTPSSVSPSPTPQHVRPLQAVVPRQESPLDFLFQADRASKVTKTVSISSSLAPQPTKSAQPSSTESFNSENGAIATGVVNRDPVRSYSPQFHNGTSPMPQTTNLADKLTSDSDIKPLGINLWRLIPS
jgi:hypothetical protein